MTLIEGKMRHLSRDFYLLPVPDNFIDQLIRNIKISYLKG